jgi:hypothetical protein
MNSGTGAGESFPVVWASGPATPAPALTKPAVTRNHLLTMNLYDAWYQCDWSAHSTAKFADLLSLPVWEVVRKHNL